VGCKKIVTELAVLEVTPEGFKLLERAPGVEVEHIASTEAELIIEGTIPEMVIDKGYLPWFSLQTHVTRP
jgi:3-oxoacid CoA-transferase subunit B